MLQGGLTFVDAQQTACNIPSQEQLANLEVGDGVDISMQIFIDGKEHSETFDVLISRIDGDKIYAGDATQFEKRNIFRIRKNERTNKYHAWMHAADTIQDPVSAARIRDFANQFYKP